MSARRWPAVLALWTASCGGEVVVSVASTSGASGDSGAGGIGADGGRDAQAGPPCGATSIEDEAEACVKKIAAAAVAAFERTGKLCDEGDPLTFVPSDIPAGTTYTPTNAPGEDYNTGDTTRGWVCLGFSESSPQHFGLMYDREGLLLAPSVGLETFCPGTTCFLAVAAGDRDGDHVVSHFIVGGHVEGGTVVLTDVLTKDPFE